MDEWLPTLETNAAQTDVEVLELLLRQLGYPSNPLEDVRRAWLGGVRTWRDKKAQDERHVTALRAYLEMGAMASNLDDLPPELHEPSALMNATLAQFEVPIDMAIATVKAELLQELDMDGDDVSERAQPVFEAGLALHMEWRRAISQAKLATTLDQLLALVRPVGRVASNNMQPRGSDRLAVERLVAKALTQIPGKLTSNEQAFADLLWALNLTATAPAAAAKDAAAAADGEGSAVGDIPAEPALAPGVELAPGVLRLLRDATVTHCEGLRRQARREASIKRLQKLLVADVGADDPLALGESDAEGAHEGASDVEEGEGGVAQADRAASASAAAAPPTTWEEHGAALVADVYGGYEEQVREMQPLELLLDVLRMAQLQEDEIRKGERAALEAAIAGFLRDNAAAAERPLPLDPPTPEAAAAAAAAATRGVRASTEAQLAAAGWQASGLGAMATDKVSTILRRGGGDGSDFSLVLAALVHSLGGKVRLSVVCVPPNAVAAAAAASSSAAAQSPEPLITYLQRRCRLVTEARVGLHPSRVVSWVAARHESGAGAVGVPAPRVHFRREVDGATWLSLGWRPGEAYPGGAYLEPVDRLDEAEWTTFYPFDEHGCKWHLRGTEADSSRKPHSSPPVQSLLAGEGGADEEDQMSRMGEDFF